MYVVATAGHVDHGKSTLVRGLTGMEPDRWEEERRRGLTIDLGFAWTRLGDDYLALVDVPGHERFVPNMLAGAGPVPATMFVVAADEGWMPQSTEHLSALDALGVEHGLLAVTRADLADPEPARAQARAQLARTSLGEVATVVVSGRTGSGLDQLRAALGVLVCRLPEADPTADVRLWVDRSFTIHGVGTVVTGTLAAGTIRVGDRMALSSTGRPVTVRGLQALGTERSEVAATARVAINVRGARPDDIGRGDALLTPEAWRPTDTVDVHLRRTESADAHSAARHDGPRQLPREAVLHIGAAAVPVRIRMLGTNAARLRLGHALPLRVGDRGVLREPGLRRVAAGIVALDVAPPALERRGAGRERASELAHAAPEPAEHTGRQHLRRQRFARLPDLVAMGLRPTGRRVAEDWYVDESAWSDLVGRARDEHRRWRATHPTSSGMPREALRSRLDIPAALVDAVVGEAGLAIEDGIVRPPGEVPTLPAGLEDAITRIEADLVANPFAAPGATRLAELGLGRRELAAAERAGRLKVLTDGVVIAADGPERAPGVLADLRQPFTLSEARRALGTTRRVAVPLMELLGRTGVTEQLADGTHRLR